MIHDAGVEEHAFHSLLATERSRLVWLCAYLLDDHDQAEDAAQEVILAAWRQRAQLRSPQAGSAWLSGIARNVCAQWRRKQRSVPAPLPWVDTEADSKDAPDFTVDLERHELATLLDRALALLPEDTRVALVQKYIEESSHAMIAARLGLSENAVAVRLHRGRLALHKLLTTTFHNEAQAWELESSEPKIQQPTSIWCPFCGAQKLLVEIKAQESSARFWCPDCRHHTPMPIVWTRNPALLDGVKTYKPLLSRQLASAHAHYQRALDKRVVVCPVCGTPTHVSLRLPEHAKLLPSYLSDCGVYMHCDACTSMDATPMQHLVLDLPQTQQFWRTHGRIRLGQEYGIENNGRAALVTTFESVTTAARLVVITDTETLMVRSLAHEG